jgi:hypothetical protein
MLDENGGTHAPDKAPFPLALPPDIVRTQCTSNRAMRNREW